MQSDETDIRVKAYLIIKKQVLMARRARALKMIAEEYELKTANMHIYNFNEFTDFNLYKEGSGDFSIKMYPIDDGIGAFDYFNKENQESASEFRLYQDGDNVCISIFNSEFYVREIEDITTEKDGRFIKSFKLVATDASKTMNFAIVM